MNYKDSSFGQVFIILRSTQSAIDFHLPESSMYQEIKPGSVTEK